MLMLSFSLKKFLPDQSSKITVKLDKIKNYVINVVRFLNVCLFLLEDPNAAVKSHSRTKRSFGNPGPPCNSK